MTRALVWAALAICAVYLVFIGGGWLGIYASPLRIITVSMAGLLIAAWAIVAWRRPAWRPRSALMVPIVASLASMAISTVFSRAPRVSVEYLGYGIVLAALYLLLVRLLANDYLRPRLVRLAAGLCVVISFEYVVLTGDAWVRFWNLVGGLTQPPLRPESIGLSWGNPSAVLTIVVLFAVPAAALALSSRFPRRALMGIGALVAIVAVISGSRAGAIALAGATAIAVALVLVDPAGREAIRQQVSLFRSGRLSDLRLRAALGLVGGLILIVALLVLPGILQRATAGGEDQRATFAIAAVREFERSPIVGTGPGTWVVDRMLNTQSTEPDIYIPHAHDVPLQTLAELGVVGAVAGAFLLAGLIRLILGAIRSADRTRRPWGWVTALGMLYFGLHNLLDFYPNMPAILFAAALPVAYLDATDSPSSGWRVPTTLSRVIAIPALALVVIATIGLLALEGPALESYVNLPGFRPGDWSTAQGPVDDAATRDPDMDSFAFTAGLVAARNNDPATAARYFTRVAKRTDLPEAWRNLAAEQALLGDNGAALESIRRSLRLGWQQPVVSVPMGELALQLGDSALSTQAFASAVATLPSFAADPWLARDAAHAAIREAVLAAAYEIAVPGVQWQIALMNGELAKAATLASRAGDPQLATAVIAAWSGDPTAASRLFGQCDASPLNEERLSWCARLAGRSGDGARASKYGAVAEILSPGSSAGGFEWRAGEAGTRSGQVREPAYAWGLYTYRRPTPLDMSVPGLIQLFLE